VGKLARSLGVEKSSVNHQLRVQRDHALVRAGAPATTGRGFPGNHGQGVIVMAADEMPAEY